MGAGSVENGHADAFGYIRKDTFQTQHQLVVQRIAFRRPIHPDEEDFVFAAQQQRIR
jgi:hypothetical protein